MLERTPLCPTYIPLIRPPGVTLSFCLLPFMPTVVLTIRAVIRLYSGVGCRQSPFTSGYRPMFNFITDMKTSGAITLLDRVAFSPGEEGEVGVTFLRGAYLGRMGIGTRFTFGEGRASLGEGEVAGLWWSS